ncbi:MAG: VIT1/CCC1 transporter family protein [Ornithinimicrobium sp.]
MNSLLAGSERAEALVGLFMLGYSKGRFVRVSPIKNALEIVVIGGLATGISIAVGNVLAV